MVPGDICQITYVSFTFLGSSRTGSYNFRKFLRTESQADTRGIDETNQYVNTQCCDFRWCSQTVDGSSPRPPPTFSLMLTVNVNPPITSHSATRSTTMSVRVPRFVFNSVLITYLSIFIADFVPNVCEGFCQNC